MSKDTLKKAKYGKPIFPTRSRLHQFSQKELCGHQSHRDLRNWALEFFQSRRAPFWNKRIAAAFVDDSGIRFWVKRLAEIYQARKDDIAALFL